VPCAFRSAEWRCWFLFLVIVFAVPHPQSIKPTAWRFFSIFIVTVLGLMIEPIPGGALVLLGVTLAAVFGGMTISQVLSGYSDPVVWLTGPGGKFV
jgi:DASS family divalent anion:Na+ symporter